MNDKRLGPLMWLTCFKCGHAVANDEQITSPSEFILDRTKQGWRADGLRILCPNCATGK